MVEGKVTVKGAGGLAVIVSVVVLMLLVSAVRCSACYDSECGGGKRPAMVHGVCMCIEEPR